jgi:hypothetical protein
MNHKVPYKKGIRRAVDLISVSTGVMETVGFLRRGYTLMLQKNIGSEGSEAVLALSREMPKNNRRNE